MNTIKGALVLNEAVESLDIDLAALVAACAFWSPADADATKPAYPHVRRARSGEKRGTETPDGLRLDDNTFANRVSKAALSHLGKFEGFAVCHIWPQTCYDEGYHTMPANLVLLPRALAGLTDHHPAVEQCLQYRAWELYKWFPDGQPQPEKPANYPGNWREPASKPTSVKPSGTRGRQSNHNGQGRDVLPIILDPSDPDAFRTAFIKRGLAKMSIHYGDGRTEEETWLCQRFGPSSNVIGNLRSKAKFRSGEWQRIGITKVVVEIPSEAGCAQ